MPHRRSRRDLICEAALDLAAEGGNHALTHQKIDARLGLAKGSTSYYYRTRHALVAAAIAHLTSRSRRDFHQSLSADPPRTVDEASTFIVDQLEILVMERRNDVLARYALVTDAAGDDELRAGLASCLFSPIEATRLFGSLAAPDPPGAAGDLISLLEGLVFDLVCGSRVLDTGAQFVDQRERLRTTIGLWINTLVAGS